MFKWKAEYTDTFCGEANYCWVKRVEFSLPEDATERKVVSTAKGLLGLRGVKHKREDWGELIVLRPIGECTVVFIEYVEEEGEEV